MYVNSSHCSSKNTSVTDGQNSRIETEFICGRYDRATHQKHHMRVIAGLLALKIDNDCRSSIHRPEILGKFKSLKKLELFGVHARTNLSYVRNLKNLEILSTDEPKETLFYGTLAQQDPHANTPIDLPNLTSFSNSVYYNPYGSMSMLSNFQMFSGLKLLDTAIHILSDVSIISQLTDLTSLSLGIIWHVAPTAIDSQYPFHLTALKKLKSLHLEIDTYHNGASESTSAFAEFFTRDITHSVPGIAAMQSLRDLSFKFDGITNEWFLGINCLSDLETLTIDDHEMQITDTMMPNKIFLRNLRILEIYDDRISSNFFDKLDFPNLKELRLSFFALGDINLAKTFPHIETLEAFTHGYADAEDLPKFEFLKHLSIVSFSQLKNIHCLQQYQYLETMSFPACEVYCDKDVILFMLKIFDASKCDESCRNIFPALREIILRGKTYTIDDPRKFQTSNATDLREAIIALLK